VVNESEEEGEVLMMDTHTNTTHRFTCPFTGRTVSVDSDVPFTEESAIATITSLAARLIQRAIDERASKRQAVLDRLTNEERALLGLE
jgi:hypothetical protein